MEESGELWPMNKSTFQLLFNAEYSNSLLLSKKLYDLFISRRYKDLPRAEDPLVFRDRQPPKLYIKYISENIGYGVFAGEDIALGQFIGHYSGRLIARSGMGYFPYGREYNVGYIRRKPTNKFVEKRADFIKGDFFINAAKYGNHTRLINHNAKAANTELMAYTFKEARYVHLGVIAACPIKKGEEILDNYGDDYWEGVAEFEDGLRPLGRE